MRVLTIALVGAVGLFLLFVGCVILALSGVFGPSVSETREHIERHVRTGASLEEIKTYLDTDAREIDITYSPTDNLSRASQWSALSDLIEQGLSPDAPVFQANRRGGNIQLDILFVLDDEYRFQLLVIDRDLINVL